MACNKHRTHGSVKTPQQLDTTASKKVIAKVFTSEYNEIRKRCCRSKRIARNEVILKITVVFQTGGYFFMRATAKVATANNTKVYWSNWSNVTIVTPPKHDFHMDFYVNRGILISL